MNSIRSRLLVLLLIGLTIVVVAGGCSVYWIERASLQEQFDSSLLARAQTIAALVKAEPVRVDGEIRISNVYEAGDGPVEVLEQTYFEYYFEGRLLRHRRDLDEPTLGHRDPPDGKHEYDDMTLPGGMTVRAIWMQFVPRVDADDWTGIDTSQMEFRPIVVAVAVDRAPIDGALATLGSTLAIVGGIVILTIGLLVFFGVRWGLRPLDQLRRQLGEVSGRQTDDQIESSGAPQELQPVYEELNRMLARVEQTLERERSFAGAAAHELRTPLSELRSTAEIAIRWPDADRAQTALEETLAIGREMEHLVESLLHISRGLVTKDDEPQRSAMVHPIIRDCLERADNAIRERALDVSVDVAADDALPGSPEALEIILRNLIDNAVRYTPKGGSVVVRNGSPNNGSHSLVVENGPVALTDDDLDRLFQPFWQAQTGRSDRAHVGLGLSVVRQAADACRLSIDAALQDDCLRIRLSDRRSHGERYRESPGRQVPTQGPPTTST